ncbi:hypothetical protein [Streptomyces sp. NRRL S-1521]|uniref:hypothetical protein n=1 Tax=Streptomyces sp. NRRL S-1521 TaxID=1609100 RepID=UPI00074A4D78|nr:hypothetical protein [Streptomyces sp. NRRL S-1521]KUL48988.1 hypothetical protein ADL30_34540 [Streptomyces sp. NRRL S-1521]
MAYEMITVEFRTELHARWSVFFDHLAVPWAYEPMTFYDGEGRTATPAFWLPRERIWFDAELDRAPTWWPQFSTAAGEYDFDPQLWGESHTSVPPVKVDEEWQGRTLLSVGWIPDGYGSTTPVDGPWSGHEWRGMNTGWDVPYQWTLCPVCGSFGAEFWGYAERLSCGCLDDREHRKVAGGGDERLMRAYQAAAGRINLSGSGAGPVRREALVRQEGAALAQERCVGRCRTVGEELRAELPCGAYVDHEADSLCSACPGFVCAQCSEKPASAAGGVCRVCAPLPLLTDDLARALMNEQLIKLSRIKKEPLRALHPQANRVMGVRRRYEASLPQLAVGLAHIEQWLADPETLQLKVRTLAVDEISTLGAGELRAEIAARVGPLCAAVGLPPMHVQIRINDVMGVRSRADADEEQLRTGLRQTQAWLQSPRSYTTADKG